MIPPGVLTTTTTRGNQEAVTCGLDFKVVLENYLFLRLYSIDFDTALAGVRLLRQHTGSDLQTPLIRDIAVTYARPFSENRGVEQAKHCLRIKYVPKNARALHKTLISLRNKQFAHTDIEFRAPKVVRWGTTENPWYPMSFRSFDSSLLVRRLSEIETLIEGVSVKVKEEMRILENLFGDQRGLPGG